MIILLMFAVLTGTSAFFMLRAATFRRLQVEAMLARIPGYGYTGRGDATDPRRVLRAIGRFAPGGRGAQAEALRAKITAAGWSRYVTPEDIAGLKLALPALVFVACILAGATGLLGPTLALLGGLLGASLAYLGLPIAIDMRVRRRGDKIVMQLPTVLDLLTLSVESGMSFDAALQRLVRRMHGPLVDELELMVRETQLGSTRNEALRALAARVEAPEVSTFVRALTQSDRLGVPLAQMLRTQSDELRTRLRNEAEEAAMKAPVKMLFPTVLLIFPAVFIVILGPAMLSITKTL
jgi:tight adherence protein C